MPGGENPFSWRFFNNLGQGLFGELEAAKKLPFTPFN
jgi:hypothetical protein